MSFVNWQIAYLTNFNQKVMFKRIIENPKNETFQSYLGILSHGNTIKIKQILD